jgi:hypothetical protein
LISWAAGGIVIVMVGATIFHLGRGELSSAAITAMLLGMAVCVAYTRNRVLPVPVRRAAG